MRPPSGSTRRPEPAPASPQVPIHALWNDGRENLLGALLLAGQYVIPEVPPPPVGGAGLGAARGGGWHLPWGMQVRGSAGLKLRLSP